MTGIVDRIGFLSQPIVNALDLQRDAQRYRYVAGVGAGGRLLELCRNVTPRRPIAVAGREMAEKRAYIAEVHQLHNAWDYERLRQTAGPIYSLGQTITHPR